MKKKKPIIIFISCCLIISLLSSCESLPTGEPPKGKIVEIRSLDKKVYSKKDALNTMITAMCTSSPLSNKKNPPKVAFLPSDTSFKKYNMILNSLAVRVYKELFKIGIIKVAPNKKMANLAFKSSFTKPVVFMLDEDTPSQKFKWEVKILPSQGMKEIWSHSLIVGIKNKDNKE